MKMKTIIIWTATAILAFSGAAQADMTTINGHTLLADWGGFNSGSISLPLDAKDIHPDVSAAYMTQSGLGTKWDNRGVWYSSNTESTLDPATAPYVSYTVEFSESVSVDFDRFALQGFDMYPYESMIAEVRWDVDDFTSGLGTLTGGRTAGTWGYKLTSVDLSEKDSVVADSVEFRIYTYNVTGMEGMWNSATGAYESLDGTPDSYGYRGATASIFVNDVGEATVAPVPTPGAALLGLLGLSAAGAKLRRRPNI